MAMIPVDCCAMVAAGGAKVKIAWCPESKGRKAVQQTLIRTSDSKGLVLIDLDDFETPARSIGSSRASPANIRWLRQCQEAIERQGNDDGWVRRPQLEP
jgi:hypothetical protein